MTYMPIVLFVVTVISYVALTILRRKQILEEHFYSLTSRHVDYENSSDIRYKIKRSDKVDALRKAYDIRRFMQVAVSLVLLIVAIVIVMSRAYGEQEKHWAYGSLGTILGYWLKN